MRADISLTLYVSFTTGNIRTVRQIAATMNTLEVWTERKLDALIRSAPVDAELVETTYSLDITNRGQPDHALDRAWQVSPDRHAFIEVEVADKAALLAHLDTYYLDLQTHIETMLNAPQATITAWHIHMSDGSVDEGPR